MVVCSSEVIQHLTKLGYVDAVKEIDKLIKTEKAQNKRFNDHLTRVKEFISKIMGLGMCDMEFSWSQGEYSISFEGHYEPNRQLAKNLGVYYGEGYDYEGIEEGRMSFPSELVLNWMHLWINKYQDFDYDIYQSKLVFK